MQHFAPDYYPDFRCIASACRHSCCVGWEIDIDPVSRAAYRRVEGEFGRRLAEYIADDGESACFRLDEHERCPLLRADGLCEMILELGEDALCQICRDHPRYRNSFANRVELGVGLCCEAAAELILSRQSPMVWLLLADDGDDMPVSAEEGVLFDLRERVVARMQDRSKPLALRMAEMLDFCGVSMAARPPRAWAAIYAELERLDPAWDEVLARLDCGAMEEWPEIDPAWEVPFEQLAVYFLCRHLPGALDDGCTAERIGFAMLSTVMIGAAFSCAAERSMETLIDLARMYSAEIEYDEENVEAILDEIADWRGDAK